MMEIEDNRMIFKCTPWQYSYHVVPSFTRIIYNHRSRNPQNLVNSTETEFGKRDIMAQKILLFLWYMYKMLLEACRYAYLQEKEK